MYYGTWVETAHQFINSSGFKPMSCLGMVNMTFPVASKSIIHWQIGFCVFDSIYSISLLQKQSAPLQICKL